MRLSPKVITGCLSAQNKGACDWGWQGLVAYGCHNCVVVVDPTTIQVLQVLDKHRTSVVKVKWSRENYHHDIGSPYNLRLASADNWGNIIIWDVAQGEAKIEFSDGTKPILALEWLSWQDASHDLLVALHPPYSVILWNADTGIKLWKKSYTESFISFALDPFCVKNMAILGQDCIVFIDDFSITKTPSSNGKKFYISSPSSSGSSKSDTPVGSLERKPSSSRNLAKKMTKILVGEGKQKEDENIALNECIQLLYLRSCRHHLVLVYSREILILDLEINQTVGIIPAERTGSPFMEILPMQQRDVLYCLHENGSITCRVRRKTNVRASPPPEGTGAFDDSGQTSSMDVMYDLRCQSDSIRMTRHCRVSGVMYSPVSESRLAIVLSDSRVIFWDLQTIDFQVDPRHPKSPLYTPGNFVDTGEVTVKHPRLALCDMIGQSPVLSPDNDSALKGHGVVLRFLMTGLLNGINANISVIRMCPALTTKNWNIYEPLLAVGSQLGTVQIINVGTGQIDREYSVHTGVVRGIEWASLKSFMSYSYPKPTGSNLVKNEMLLVDIISGKVTPVRTQKDQESPIEMLRISHLKQYFIVAFKDKALELWDIKTMTMLRELGKSMPFPTALEWSPSLRHLKKKLQVQPDLVTQQQPQGIGSSGTSGGSSGTSSASTGTSSGNTMTSSSGASSNTGTSGISSGTSSLMSGSLVGSKSTEGDESGTMETSSNKSTLSESTVTSTTTTTTSSDEITTKKISVREHFVYTDNDGNLYHFLVEGSSFTDGSKINPESGMGTITWLAWKGDYLTFGDADGQLCLWDLKAKTSRVISTHRGWIKKVRFAPGRGNYKCLILYNEGVDIWDIVDNKLSLVSCIKSPKEICKVVDAEWSGSDRPVLATVDGCIHMLDISLKISSSPVEERELPDDVWSPYLLTPKATFLMKYLLQNQPWYDKYRLELEDMRTEDKDVQKQVNKNISLINQDVKVYLSSKITIAERCLITARLFGDESEIKFWTVALYYMRSGRHLHMSKSSSSVFAGPETGDLFIPATPSYKEAHDLVDLSETSDGKIPAWKTHKDKPLEKCYDFLCDNETYKKYQIDRVNLHDSKRVTYEHTKKCAETYMMLGESDKAVHLLLETDPENDGYYTDCLRSCLVASIRSSGASQSTIKLVATNLIANGKLMEGVQLLCLIDKGIDACRYLQTYGVWEPAVWLAKSTLSYTECCEVLKRWVEHLSSTQVNQKSQAVLVLISLGYFIKVIEMLYGMRQFNRAACFIEAAQEFDLLEETEENNSLIEAVFLEYARQLSNLGHRQAAEYYCEKAGKKGQQLLKEVQILFS
ncbi:WD repeat-containing protein 11 [Mactra antiquata]